jgi:uncharacterized protein (DUF305 family)
MKTIIRHLKTVDVFSLLIGVGLTLVVFTLLSYYRGQVSDAHMADGHMMKEEVSKVGTTQMMKNPYMMGKITSERQFLQEMKLHHESAVQMAQQVLLLQSLHPEVKKLANDIITAQTTEIKMIKDWLAAWR